MSLNSVERLNETFQVPQSLLEKYSTHGPRYTSYPTAPMWKDDFGPAEYRRALEETNAGTQVPLSLYVHLPFCESRCLFCGCNVVITRQKDQAEKYLGYLFKEIEMAACWMDTGRPVVQSHWGGGTPTYLSVEQMERLFRFQQKHFQLQPGAEIAIEVDPRVTTPEQIELLHALGFNRISMGIQDFQPEVQEAIHRIQPIAQTEAMVQQCRDLGFDGLNFDLIYGLPHQTVDTFGPTLSEVIRLNPDRIALYHYAHVPWMSPHQNQIPEAALPNSMEKMRIFQLALQTLTEAGYLYIGMDHFARPHDELAKAQQAGTLRRNFMGYTTQAGSDLYGFGVSAISGFDRYYSQNRRKLSEYYEALEAELPPTMRGAVLSEEDLLRRAVINRILCHGQLHYGEIEAEFGLASFRSHFELALGSLEGFAEDGLLTFTPTGFQLPPLGRVFSRNVAMRFDAYLEGAAPTQHPTYSKTV